MQLIPIPSKPAPLTTKTIDPARLRHNFTRFAKGSRSANTHRTYASQWRTYIDWCTENGLKGQLGAPATVAAYVSYCFDGEMKLPTLGVALAAIKFNCKRLKLADPTTDHDLQELLEGVRRTMATEGRATKEVANTVSLAELRAMVASCGPDLPGIRNKAMMLVCFGGWLRRSELLDMQVERLSWELNRVLLTLGVTKTNQKGRKLEVVQIPRIGGANADLCPYAALEHWLQEAGIDRGPVWRRVYRDRISAEGITDGKRFWQIVQIAAASARLENISPHRAFRASPITIAINAGQSMPDVMKKARHKAANTTTMYFDEVASGQDEVSRSVYG